MWRSLSTFVVAVATAAGTQVALSAAEVVYIEDFEDANGAPAFDPLFSHVFSASDEDGQPIAPNWAFYENNDRFPGHGTLLALGSNTQDSVQFNLASSQVVMYASVDFYVWPHSSAYAQYYYVDFIGSDAHKRILLPHRTQFSTLECTSEEIGLITEIRMCSIEGVFDNVTIHVVPEPSVVLLVHSVLGALLAVAALRRQIAHCP